MGLTSGISSGGGGTAAGLLLLLLSFSQSAGLIRVVDRMMRHSGGGSQQQYHNQQQQKQQQQQKRKYPGITAPISLQTPKAEDLELTDRLEDCLRSYDLFESEEEMSHRVNVLSQINVIAKEWIVQVSVAKNFTPDKAEQMSAKIFTFGSFRLGVHTKGLSCFFTCVKL